MKQVENLKFNFHSLRTLGKVGDYFDGSTNFMKLQPKKFLKYIKFEFKNQIEKDLEKLRDSNYSWKSVFY
jgi:hypothetical protein